MIGKNDGDLIKNFLNEELSPVFYSQETEILAKISKSRSFFLIQGLAFVGVLFFIYLGFLKTFSSREIVRIWPKFDILEADIEAIYYQ